MSRKSRRLARARERQYGDELKKERRASFALGSLWLALMCFVMFLLDLIQGKVFLAYGGGMGTFTRADSPVVYWLFISIYFVSGVVFTRMFLKDCAEAE